MSICPNCGSKRIIWGSDVINQEQENQEQEQENSLVFSPEPNVIIGNENTLVSLNSNKFTFKRSGEEIVSLVFCKNCGTAYNGLNSSDAHKKVKEHRKKQKPKDPMGRYSFIRKNEK